METLHFKKFIIFKFSIRIFVSSLLTMSASPTTLQNLEKEIEMYYMASHFSCEIILCPFLFRRSAQHIS